MISNRNVSELNTGASSTTNTTDGCSSSSSSGGEDEDNEKKTKLSYYHQPQQQQLYRPSNHAPSYKINVNVVDNVNFTFTEPFRINGKHRAYSYSHRTDLFVLSKPRKVDYVPPEKTPTKRKINPVEVEVNLVEEVTRTKDVDMEVVPPSETVANKIDDQTRTTQPQTQQSRDSSSNNILAYLKSMGHSRFNSIFIKPKNSKHIGN